MLSNDKGKENPWWMRKKPLDETLYKCLFDLMPHWFNDTDKRPRLDYNSLQYTTSERKFTEPVINFK